MTTKLYRIRHGESVGNVEPIIGGPRGDRGLTDRGRKQARLLEQRLRAERPHAHRLHTSTLPRARDTADYVAGALRLPAQPTDDSTNCALARPTASRWTNGAHATPCDPQLG